MKSLSIGIKVIKQAYAPGGLLLSVDCRLRPVAVFAKVSS